MMETVDAQGAAEIPRCETPRGPCSEYALLAIAPRIASQSRKRAKRSGIEFALTTDDVILLLQRSEGRCELTGIYFDLTEAGGNRRPWHPSLDRIDSKGGYSLDNCRIISVAANLAMNEWGEGALKALAHGYLSKTSPDRTQALLHIASIP